MEPAGVEQKAAVGGGAIDGVRAGDERGGQSRIMIAAASAKRIIKTDNRSYGSERHLRAWASLSLFFASSRCSVMVKIAL